MPKLEAGPPVLVRLVRAAAEPGFIRTETSRPGATRPNASSWWSEQALKSTPAPDVLGEPARRHLGGELDLRRRRSRPAARARPRSRWRRRCADPSSRNSVEDRRGSGSPSSRSAAVKPKGAGNASAARARPPRASRGRRRSRACRSARAPRRRGRACSCPLVVMRCGTQRAPPARPPARPRGAALVGGEHLPVAVDAPHRGLQALRLRAQAHVLQHQRRRQDRRGGIRDALARDVGRRAVHGLEVGPARRRSCRTARGPRPPAVSAPRSERMSP